MSLSTTIKSIQSIMRKDAGIDGDAQRIGQLGWMLFFKIFSDLEIETELEDDDYESPVPAHLRWNAWANEDLIGTDAPTGDELLELVDGMLFPTFKDLNVAQFTGKARPRAELLRSVFEDAYNYMKSGTLMRQVINKINRDIDFNQSKTRHLLGDIYEQILRDLQGAGNAGEFYTPRAATQFAVAMVAPRLGETVLDPACGTGGFLTAAFEHMRNQADTAAQLAELKASVRGVEKKALPHLLGTTNLMLHGIEVPRVRHGNTLSRPLRDYGPNDQVDVIVTNPPFGGMEEDGIENNFPAEFRTRETADLFLVLVMELLRDGGRAAIVLPDGTLFGEGIKTRIKKRLLEECNLHTIVRLPKGVFAPYTTIKTNILFFTKGEPTKDVWFYEHPYPEGYKSYSKTKPMRIEEFEREKAWWDKREVTEQSWKVTADDIASGGYNLDITNPSVVDDGHEDPDMLLARYEEATAEVESAREALRSALADPLRRHSATTQVRSTALHALTEAETPDDLHRSWERVSTNWSALTSQPEMIQMLRATILSLAVSGRLSEQDPQDQPAAELLRDIADRQLELKALQRLRGVRLPVAPSSDHAPSIPKGWTWARLGALLRHCRNGIATRPNEAGVGYPLLRISAGTSDPNGWVNLDDHKFAELDADDAVPYVVDAGDLLVCRFNGNLRYVGRAAVVPEHDADYLHPDKLIRVKAFSTDHRYLMIAMNSRLVRDQIEGVASTTAGNIGINGAQLQALQLPVPPHAEQTRIADRVERLFDLCAELEASLPLQTTATERLASGLASLLVGERVR